MGESSVIVLKSIEEGWLEMEVLSSAESVSLRLPSQSCEPLAELGETILKLHAFYNSSDSNKSNSPLYTFWEGDNWLYTWSFAPLQQREVEVEITYCPDIYAGIHTKTELKLSSKIPLEQLTLNLFNEMKQILLRYGFIGYKRKWKHHDFPIALFLRLYNTLTDVEKAAVDFPSEMGSLQQIFK